MSLSRKLKPIAKRWISKAITASTAQKLEHFFADIKGDDGPPNVADETAVAAAFLPANGGIVVDAGANCGKWAQQILFHGRNRISRILLIEPQASLLAGLATIANAEIISAALGQRKGPSVLYKPQDGSELASLTKRKLDHVGLDMMNMESVNVITLDDLASERNLDRIDVLKLDIEGHELDALTGAARLFAEHRIGYVQFEFGGCNIDTRTYVRDFWHFFNDRDFSIGRIYQRQIVPLPHYSETLEAFNTANFAAWPRQ